MHVSLLSVGRRASPESEARVSRRRLTHSEVREETDQNDDGEWNAEQQQENRAHRLSPLFIVDVI
jgi:hypothetical protein